MARYRPKDSLSGRILKRILKPFNNNPIGCLIIAIYLVLFVVPLIPLWLLLRAIRMRYFHRELKRQNRVISWDDFLLRTKSGSGTIIVEAGNKAGTRFWWSEEKILTKAPISPPKISELDLFSYGGLNQHPFIEWCYDKYISLDSGTALYVDRPERPDFKDFPIYPEYESDMKKRFPNQEIVTVTFYDTRYC